MRFKYLLSAAMLVLPMANPSLTQASFLVPPTTGAIYDLNGQAIPDNGAGDVFQTYTASFTASAASTAVTFAFVEDGGGILTFENASVVDSKNTNANLLLNGNFAGAIYTSNGNSSTPVNWTYAGYGSLLTSPGYVQPASYKSPASWVDGAAYGYDTISQTIATTIGDQYQVAFTLTDNSGYTNYSNSNSVGTPAIDVLTYAQPAGTAAPIPATALLLGSGLAGLIGLKRKYLG